MWLGVVTKYMILFLENGKYTQAVETGVTESQAFQNQRQCL